MSETGRDYIVVGGGPAGAISARHLSEFGRVLLFSKLKTETHHCTGLISKKGLECIGVTGGDFVLNEVSGAKLISPKGRVVEVDGGETKACVVDRNALDEHLREKAEDAGVELIKERAVVTKDRTVEAGGLRYNADRIVLASGTDYSIHRRLGLDAPDRFLVGSQYEMNVACSESKVELYFNVPGFFSWVVPAGEYARVGAATEGNPIPHLDALVKALEKDGRLESKKIHSKMTGLIPVHKPSIKTQYDGLVTVGDAAGHVKATTGGGVVYGGIAAAFTGRGDYDRAWRKAVGGELRMHLLIRKTLNRMSDAGFDRLLSVVADHKSVLEERGDMDSAKQTVTALAQKPGFLLSLIRNAPSLLFDLI